MINEVSVDTNIPKGNDILVNLLYSLTGVEKKWVVVFEPDYDDMHQFARKCIKSLSAIGNENALKNLRLLSASKISKVMTHAQIDSKDVKHGNQT